MQPDFQRAGGRGDSLGGASGALPPLTTADRNLWAMAPRLSAEALTRGLALRESNLVDAGDVAAQDIRRQLTGVIAREVLGFSESAGLVLHSGSEANAVALQLARERTGGAVVLASTLAHSSVRHACERLGLQLVELPAVESSNFQVSPEDLHKAVQRHLSELAAIVVTVGTTDLGNVETALLAATMDVTTSAMLTSKKIWLHLDAAYGGFQLALQGGLESVNWTRADSVCVDPHKFVGLFDCSVLLFPGVREHELPIKIGEPHNQYFPSIGARFGTSRSTFPAAVALAEIELLGLEGLRALARSNFERASSIAEKLTSLGYTLITPVCSGVVPVGFANQEQRDLLLCELVRAGFRASPLFISGENSEMWGIRMVVTPRRGLDDTAIASFIDFMRRNREKFGIAPN